MAKIILGVGEAGAAREPGSTIKTFALGSCVAVVLLDPKVRAIGMAHIALPKSKTNPERAKERPGYFADTAIPGLLDQMAELGCSRKGEGFVVKLAGGAMILDMNKKFDIGNKNTLASKKQLWKFGLAPVAEDTGGNSSRTVEVNVDTGKVVVSSSTGESWEI